MAETPENHIIGSKEQLLAENESLRGSIQKVLAYCDKWAHSCEEQIRAGGHDALRLEYFKTKAHTLNVVAGLLSGEVLLLDRAIGNVGDGKGR